ncbi:MAG: tetratricopeptide repeat protein [Phycisphaeraceae bacterium]|nr:tetratricopeptide repeat protein [Phycisphaerales bacterium]MCB9860026.1 tetratricopeptide repeat protein [Phycisphaeraceae bacterium]
MVEGRLISTVTDLAQQNPLPLEHIVRITRIAVALYPTDYNLLLQRQWILSLVCSLETIYRPDRVSEGDQNKVTALRDSYLDICGRVLAIDDCNAESWYHQSCALDHLERYEEAIKSARKAHSIEPTPDTTCQIAHILQSLERDQEAVRFIDTSGYTHHPDVQEARRIIVSLME